MKHLLKNYVYPVSVITGSIIGVGFLSLPYITLRVGTTVMAVYFIALTALVTAVHVIFGKVCLKTPDFKRLPGFAGFYFGRWVKGLVLTSMSFGLFGVLLSYLVIGSSFLSGIFNGILGGNALNYVLLYFSVASIFVYFGLKAISKINFLVLILLAAAILTIFIKGFSHINLSNFLISAADFKIPNLFLPYGTIIFSLWGIGLIPEADEMMRGGKKSLKKIIIISTLTASVFYFLFILLILGISGASTTESAIMGLKNFFDGGFMPVVLSIGVMTTFVAFISQGLLLKKIFIYDLKIKELPAFVLTVFPPLLLFLLGFTSFIPIISFIGGVFLGIDGILVMLMYVKIGGRKIVAYPLIAVFMLGIAYSLIYFTSK